MNALSDHNFSDLERGSYDAPIEHKCNLEQPLRVLSIEQHVTADNLGRKLKLNKVASIDWCRGCREKNKSRPGRDRKEQNTNMHTIDRIDRNLIICHHRRSSCPRTYNVSHIMPTHVEDYMNKVQEMVRKDMGEELDALLNEIENHPDRNSEIERDSFVSCASKMSSSRQSTLVEKGATGDSNDPSTGLENYPNNSKARDGIASNIYHAKFPLPLTISGRRISENPIPDIVPNRIFDSNTGRKFDAAIEVTLLQMAVIAGSINSIKSIVKHLDVNDVIPSFQERVKMKLVPEKDCEFQKRDLNLHGMNVFHLIAKYCPSQMETIHKLAKDRLQDVELHGVSCAEQKSPSVEKDDIKGERVNLMSEPIKDEKVESCDSDDELLVQNICNGKRLMRLDMLLEKRNVLKKTPLSIAVDNFNRHQTIGAIR